MTLYAKLLTLFMCTIFSVNVYSADFSGGKQGSNYVLSISGKIQRGDFDKFINIIKSRESFPFMIMVKSLGGDVFEAIKIAKLIRRSMISVVVPFECYSSCTYLVFASPNFVGSGILGLHRPYYDKKYFSKLSSDLATKKYQQLNKLVRTFLLEMDVPTELIDKMMATSSNDMIYIPIDSFIKAYGNTSPAVDEWLRAKCGSFSPDEERDWKAIVPSLFDVKTTPEQSRKIGAMSSGYIKYMKDKNKKLAACRNINIKSEQKKILSEYMKR